MRSTNSFARRLRGTDAGGGALALRIPAGIIFAAHGAQKLFGWFGGYGLVALVFSGARRGSLDRALSHSAA